MLRSVIADKKTPSTMGPFASLYISKVDIIIDLWIVSGFTQGGL
jgi:hypothetical protein